MNDGRTGAFLMIFGSLFFPLVYRVTKFCLDAFFKHRFSTGDIYLICEKVTCSLQAVLSFIVGATIVSSVEDIMVDTHWLTNSYAYFGLPYFIHDVVAMFNSYRWNQDRNVQSLPWTQQLPLFVRESPLLLVHHVVMPIIIFPMVVSLRSNRGDFFVGAFYMIEVTIPFISMRAVLAQLQMKEGRLYIAAGLLMLSTFFCSRVLFFPALYWRYARYAGLHFLQVPSSIPLKCNLGCLMIWLPQFYWFGLMLRGSFLYFQKRRIRNKVQDHNQ